MVDGGLVGGGVQTHFHVKPNSVEVVLRLSWGCNNNKMRPSWAKLSASKG